MKIIKLISAVTVMISLVYSEFASAESGPRVSSPAIELCSEWNSYLGMLNVNEYTNSEPADRSIDITLSDFLGMEQSVTSATVLASAQRDILVHELSGFSPNSYGRTCVQVTNGGDTDIDGRTIYYRPNIIVQTVSSSILLSLFLSATGSWVASLSLLIPMTQG